MPPPFLNHQYFSVDLAFSSKGYSDYASMKDCFKLCFYICWFYDA